MDSGAFREALEALPQALEEGRAELQKAGKAPSEACREASAEGRAASVLPECPAVRAALAASAVCPGQVRRARKSS